MRQTPTLMLQSAILMSLASLITSMSSLPPKQSGDHSSILTRDRHHPSLSLPYTQPSLSGIPNRQYPIQTEPITVLPSSPHISYKSDISTIPLSANTQSSQMSSYESVSRFPNPSKTNQNDLVRSSPQHTDIHPSNSHHTPHTDTISHPTQQLRSSVSHLVSSNSEHKSLDTTPAGLQLYPSTYISSTPVEKDNPVSVLMDTSHDIHVTEDTKNNIANSLTSSGMSQPDEYSSIEPSSAIILEHRNYDENTIIATPLLESTQDFSIERISPTTKSALMSSKGSEEFTPSPITSSDLTYFRPTASETTEILPDVEGMFSKPTALHALRASINDVPSTIPPQGTLKPHKNVTAQSESSISGHENNASSTNYLRTNKTSSQQETSMHNTFVLNNSTVSNSTINPTNEESDLLSLKKNDSSHNISHTFTTNTPPQSITKPSHVNYSISSGTDNTTGHLFDNTTGHLFDNTTKPQLSTLTNSTTTNPTSQDVSILHKILFQTVPSSYEQNNSLAQPRSIYTTGRPLSRVNKSSSIDISPKSQSSTPSILLSTLIHNESQLQMDVNLSGNSTNTTTGNRTHDVVPQANAGSNRCNCSVATTNALKLEIYLLRKFIPRQKTVKSSQTAFKLEDDDFTPVTTDSPAAGDQQDSGVVCYDDRMSISSQEVDCPTPTFRKTALQDHHLQQILKNEGANSVHSYVSAEDIETIDIDLAGEKVSPRMQLLNNVQSLLGEQLSFHQSLRRIVIEYFISSKTRDILSLTSFLQAYVSKTGRDDNSDMLEDSDLYFYCKMMEVDMDNIIKSFSLLERDMLKTESQPNEKADIEHMLEKIKHYNYRSSKLIRLKDDLEGHLMHLKSTFKGLSYAIGRNAYAKTQSKQNTSDVPSQPQLHSTSNSDESAQSKHKNNFQNLDKQACASLEANINLERTIDVSSEHKEHDLKQSQESENLLNTYKREFGCYGAIVSELFASISMMLKEFKMPEDSTAALNIQHGFENRTATLKDDFTGLTHRRVKRSMIGTSDEVCQDQGSLVPNTDFKQMCSKCVKTTKMSTDYFPRHITESTCKNQGPVRQTSGSVSVQNGCLSVGGQPGGWCQQQTMTILLLHRTKGKCMKIASRGREFITDQWKLITYKLRTGCECVVDKNSQFANYLTFG